MEQIYNEEFLESEGLVNEIPYWVTTERMSPVYLTRDDIYDLGFLRSNPSRKIYEHKDKPGLVLYELDDKDFAVKEFAVVRVLVVDKTKMISNFIAHTDIKGRILYSSTKPSKESIEQVINNYAG